MRVESDPPQSWTNARLAIFPTGDLLKLLTVTHSQQAIARRREWLMTCTKDIEGNPVLALKHLERILSIMSSSVSLHSAQPSPQYVVCPS